MTVYGLTTDGLLVKTYDVLVDEMDASLRAAFGESIDLSNGILAKFRAIVCEKYTELWEQLEAVNSSQDPDKATGTALEALCALTGTVKNPATYSAVTLTLTGTPATVVTAGSRAATVSTLAKFATAANATIVLQSSWAAGVYTLGQRVTNASRVYQCITPGTSAAAGPTGTDADYADGGGVHWRYLGDGTGAVDVLAAAVETGPIAALSGDILTIDTPVGGWSGVINVLDATLGANVEPDETLRQRREFELAVSGSTTADAIRAALLEVVDVTAATVFVNNTDVTDADGIPPHAIECLVRGGANQDIFNALLANVAAGIATYGNPSGGVFGTALDSQNTSHAESFSRPTEINIKVAVTLVKNSKLYPTNGDTLVKEAIVAWGDLQDTGKDVVSSAIIAQVFTVPGVLDVTICNISIDPAVPVSNVTIPISLRELAVYDTSRVAVVSSNGTP